MVNSTAEERKELKKLITELNIQKRAKKATVNANWEEIQSTKKNIQLLKEEASARSENNREQILAKKSFETRGSLKEKNLWDAKDAKEYYQTLEKESAQAAKAVKKLNEEIEKQKLIQKNQTNQDIDRDRNLNRKKELEDFKKQIIKREELRKAQEQDRQASIISREKEQEAIRNNIAERDRLKKSLKEEHKRLYENTAAQNKFNDSKAKLDKALSLNAITQKQYNNALKKEKEQLRKAEAQTKKNAKANKDLTNSVVRHLRQIETLIVAYYALSRGFQATIGKGIEVNRMVEDNTSGIAALLSANTQNILSNGKVVNSYEKFKLGLTTAKETMHDLRKASVQTYATFPQLTEIFQQAIGQTLSMGDSFGKTTEQIIGNTISLSKRMSNIAGAIGMPMDRVREEIRSLLSGNASTDSLISTMIFGSPGEANKAIRNAKDRGANGVKQLLDEVLAPFDSLESVKSFTRSLLTFEDAWSNTMRRIVDESGAFRDIQNIIDKFASNLNTNADDIVKSFDKFYNTSKELADTLYEPLGLIAAIYGVSKAWKFLSIAVATNPIGALAVGVVGASEYIKNELENKRRGGRTEEEFAAMVEEQNKKYNSPTETKKRIETLKLETEARIEGYRKTIGILKEYGKDYTIISKAIKQAEKDILQYDQALKDIKPLAENEKTKATLKEIGKLQTKYAININNINTRTKERNKALQEELKLRQQIKETELSLEKIQTAKKTKDPKARKSFEALEKEELKNLESLKVRLAEEEQSQLNRTLAIYKKREDFRINAALRFAELKDNEFEKEKETARWRHEKNISDINFRYAKKEIELEEYETLLALEDRLYEKKKTTISLSQKQKEAEKTYKIKKEEAELLRNQEQKQKQLLELEKQRNIEKIKMLKESGELSEEEANKQIALEHKKHKVLKENISDAMKMTRTTTDALKAGMTDFFDITSDGFLNMKNLAEDVLGQILKRMIQLSVVNPLVDAITPAIGSFFSGFAFENGGIMTSQGSVPLRAYSNGGVANSPQLALYGEGKKPEAYVPLPDGRTIPVTMKMPMQEQISTPNVTTVIKFENRTSQEASLKKIGETMSRNPNGELVKTVSLVLEGINKNTLGIKDVLGA
ncbi:hypothetical protein [Brevundimonas sp. FT23042]|uniref:hypothetical protein n=1 Tax=Brevundimonas sp. FT23042 TaxID=3393749 RepID=UPI003B586174